MTQAQDEGKVEDMKLNSTSEFFGESVDPNYSLKDGSK